VAEPRRRPIWRYSFGDGAFYARTGRTMKLGTILSLLIVPFAPAATVTLNPLADAFVSSANPSSNYGGAGALAISAAGLPKGEFNSLLKFDLAAVKNSFDATFGSGLWVIDFITIQFTAVDPNNALYNGNGAGPGGSNVNFAGLFSIEWISNDAWIEGNGTPAASNSSGITFSMLPTFRSVADESLGTFAFAGGTSGSQSWNLNLSTSFAADVAAGNAVSLLMLPGDAGVSFLGGSRSITIVNSRPVLSVTARAIPEPSTIGLVTLGGLAWIARRRRQKS
jgi:hypothetical protein